MNKQYISGIVTGILMAFCVLLGFALAQIDINTIFGQQTTPTPPMTATPEALPTETFPPSSPLPSLTPSQTLKPPPTFEPPTATVQASNTPTRTPAPTLNFDTSSSGSTLGLPGATVTDTTSTCEKRDDWTLRYTVQPGDALSKIATRYNTYVSELVLANCLADANNIISGQILRVPGETQPVVPKYECTGWEPLTPFDGAFTIDPDDDLIFNWRGPVSERYLVRVVMPSGTVWEELVDLKQNLEVYLPEALPEAGNHTWYVYPLGLDFLQIPCPEGGPWHFHKEQSIALTWTPTATATFTNTPEPWMQTATANAP